MSALEDLNTPPPLTYTVRQACNALQIGRTTLWALVKQKKIKPLYIGRRVLFSRDELLRFVNGDHPNSTAALVRRER